MFKIKKYEGLITAPFTPMDKNCNLNLGIVPEYYNFLERNGLRKKNRSMQRNGPDA
jgi:predicted transcriptional regulator